MKVFNKGFYAVLAIVSVLLSACASGSGGKAASGNEAKTIKIGATAGPYSDQVTEGIKPYLEKKGYRVEVNLTIMCSLICLSIKGQLMQTFFRTNYI